VSLLGIAAAWMAATAVIYLFWTSSFRDETEIAEGWTVMAAAVGSRLSPLRAPATLRA
jgi:hypothetical protein